MRIQVDVNIVYGLSVFKPSVVIRCNALVNLINTNATDNHFFDGRVYLYDTVGLVIVIKILRCGTHANLLYVHRVNVWPVWIGRKDMFLSSWVYVFLIYITQRVVVVVK